MLRGEKRVTVGAKGERGCVVGAAREEKRGEEK